jgi:2-C-methyl-D-erythritol 2,4-cyclodiphosphate synthase
VTDDLRVGSGLDVHPVAGPGITRPLVLAGVTIPGAPGLEGHSDADVACHAVADALLAAAALGDLGSRFGTDRPEVAGADSLDGLLAAVVGDLHGAGFRVGNASITIVAQRPRLAPHRPAMVANLARVLAVAVDRVSVAFTTTDGLGAVGRGEGVAAWATVLVRR